MNSLHPQSLARAAAAIEAGAPLDAEMVKHLRQLLFGEQRLLARILDDQTIDGVEADLVWRIHDAHDPAQRDPSWHELFAEAILSHVLKDETSPDALDEAEADYLLARIGRDRQIDASELEALVSVISAVHHAPPRFQSFVLNSVADAVLADGAIDDTDVRMIRRVIHGYGSGGGKRIDERERQFLSELATRAVGIPCTALWRALLLEAGLPA